MIAILALVMLPVDIPTDTVDAIEINHFYCGEGNLVFTQAIFWEFSDSEPRLRVVAWRLWKDPSKTPTRRGKEWELVWADGETLRRVEARLFRESWTMHDPEMSNRSEWPTHKRRGLFKRRTESTPSNIEESDLLP